LEVKLGIPRYGVDFIRRVQTVDMFSAETHRRRFC
jgi:hypothetical protein